MSAVNLWLIQLYIDVKRCLNPIVSISAEAVGQEVKKKVQIIIRDGGYAILIGEYVVGQQKIPKKMLESAARCSARTGRPKSLIHHKEDNS